MGSIEDLTWIEPVALHCADSFRETAESFIIGKFKSLPKGDLSFWHPSFGDIAACATNLAFALEIYLKCLRLQVGLPPRAAAGAGHDLWRLYKELPNDVRKDIEARYERGRTQPYPANASISFAMQRSPLAADWYAGPEKSMEFEQVLKRSKDTFVSWRYVFEIQEPDKRHGRRQTFEYLLLFFACVAINAVISRNWFTPMLGSDSTAKQAWMLLNDIDFAKVSSDTPWKIADVTDQYTGKRYRIRNSGVHAIAEEL